MNIVSTSTLNLHISCFTWITFLTILSQTCFQFSVFLSYFYYRFLTLIACKKPFPIKTIFTFKYSFLPISNLIPLIWFPWFTVWICCYVLLTNCLIIEKYLIMKNMSEGQITNSYVFVSEFPDWKDFIFHIYMSCYSVFL